MCSLVLLLYVLKANLSFCKDRKIDRSDKSIKIVAMLKTISSAPKFFSVCEFIIFILLIVFLPGSGHATNYDTEPIAPPPPMLVSAQYHIHTHGVFRGLQVSPVKIDACVHTVN